MASKTDFASKYAFAFESSSDDDDAGDLGVTKAADLTQPVVVQAEKREEVPNLRQAAGQAAGLQTYFEDEDNDDMGFED